MTDYTIYPTPGIVYHHYKGGLYEVLHLAKDTATDKTVVVYRSLHFGSYYTRPIEEWFEPIQPIGGRIQNKRFEPARL